MPLPGCVAVLPGDDCHSYAEGCSEEEKFFAAGCASDPGAGITRQEGAFGECVCLLFCGVADGLVEVEVEEGGAPWMEGDVADFVKQVEPEDVRFPVSFGQADHGPVGC